MPEPAYIIQSPQFGVEVTAGTAVAANRQLTAMSVAPAPKMNNTARTIPGYRYPVAVTRGKRWTEAGFDGFLSYSDASYLFSSLLKKVTPVAGAGGNAASYTWTYTSDLLSADIPQSYTIEVGDSSNARRFAYGLVNTLSLTQEADGVSVSGNILGQSIELGVTKTASPTRIAAVPVATVDQTIGFASTFSGAATALTRVLNVSCEFSERWKPLFNTSTADSWVEAVDSETQFTAKLLMSANSTNEALITDQKNGTLKFLDWTMTGGLIPGCSTATYMVKVRAAANVTEVSEYKDQDGVYALEATLTGVLDPTTSKTVEVTVVNAVSAL